MDVINFYDKGMENVAGILGTASQHFLKSNWLGKTINIIVCLMGIKMQLLGIIELLKKILLTQCLEKITFYNHFKRR